MSNRTLILPPSRCDRSDCYYYRMNSFHLCGAVMVVRSDRGDCLTYRHFAVRTLNPSTDYLTYGESQHEKEE